MAEKNPNQLVIKDYPVALWIFGGIAFVTGAYFIVSRAAFVVGLIALGIGILVSLLPPVVTVIADRGREILILRKRALLRRSEEEYPFWDIDSVEVERSHDSEGSTTYRVALVLSSGEWVPLRGYYSSGLSTKEKQARRLREFIGVTGLESPVVRQALKAAFDYEEQGTTRGVSWRVGAASYGAAPFTRWLSEDFKLAGEFLFLAQKPPDRRDLLSWGPLRGLTGVAFKQALKMYGFQPLDTPGLESAQVYELPPLLEAHFSAYTSSPQLAGETLDPWVVNYLEGWAERYPLESSQLDKGEPVLQLVVLFSPNGLYLVYFSAHDSERSREMRDLGVDLVRALVSLPDNDQGY